MRNFLEYKSQPVVFVLGLLFWLIFQPCQAQIFEPRTSESGLNLVLLAGQGTNGVSAADYNSDGKTDLYFVVPQAYSPTNKGTWNLLFRGMGGGVFQEVNQNIGVYGKGKNIEASYMGKKLGASWGDFNNDGFPDLFLSNAGPDQLLKNNGDGSFSDITNSVDVAGESGSFSSNGLWFDYDTDGDLDLYVTVWENYEGDRTIKNRMYENEGNDLFTDVSQQSGLDDSGKTWMAVSLDINRDGLLDLYLANDFGPNRLYINHPNKTFSEETAAYGLQDPFEGMGLAIGDANNDGLFDIYLTNATQQSEGAHQTNPLFIQQPDTTFIDYAKKAGVDIAGWGWGTAFFDYDNNGWQDLYVSNGYFEAFTQPNNFFENTSTSDTLLFIENASSIGIDDQKESRSFLPFDYDNDGSVDLLISNFSEKPVLYKNLVQSGNWLKVQLEGTETNRNGFGSIIEAEADGKVFRKYHHGAHFYGQSILPIHFGFGEVTSIDQLTIYWLNGHIEELFNIPVNQSIKIREKEGLISTQNEPEFITDLPDQFNLLGNYPNPFNGTTHIQFELKTPGKVQIEMFNVLGKNIYTYSHIYSSSGLKTFSWQVSGANSGRLHSGIYFYRITQNRVSKTGKMNYIK
jgi:hypothetical protein